MNSQLIFTKRLATSPANTPPRGRLSPFLRMLLCLLCATHWGGGGAGAADTSAATVATTNSPALLGQPLSVQQSVEIALVSSPAIRQARQELEANYGVSMQILSLLIPKLKADGGYAAYSAHNAQTVGAPDNTHRWNGNVRLVQSIYEGGRLRSATKSSRLTRERAELDFQALLATKIMEIRDAYYDVLLAAEQAKLAGATLELLARQSDEMKKRQSAGLAQRYDTLKAESALANARPGLIRATNTLRIAKLRFVKLLGLEMPEGVRDDIPLALTDSLETRVWDIDLHDALAQARKNRPELEAQGKAVGLMRERLVQSKSGYKPSIQALGGYGGLSDDLNRDIYGWFGGGQFTWNIFDGMETMGKIREARARLEQAESGWSELKRTVDLEVREAHARLTEAQDMVESQKKALELAEEGLRLSASRRRAGELTDVELLTAQTAVQEARSATAQAWHDYDTAAAALDRAVGTARPGK